MFGACHRGNRGDCLGDGLVTPVEMYRLQRCRWLRQRKLRRGSEKLDDGIELAVVDASRVSVHQVAQRRPVIC
jgi:hypothetical protein